VKLAIIAGQGVGLPRRHPGEQSAQKQLRREEWDKRTLEAVEVRDRQRADCRRQAKEQNLHLLKRVRFIRTCMASGSPR
jgi:hypothetical protein